MTCPRGDGELIEKSINRPGDTTLSYAVCPTCGGHWIEAYAANFLPLPTDDKPELAGQPETVTSALTCPKCGFKLDRATGPNIPDYTLAWHCRNNHGYFFPEGQLLKFKEAQTAKINYHKLWDIPIPSISSTLLTSIIGIILSLGLVLGVIEGQKQQTTVSNAQNIILYQKAYVLSPDNAVAILATTSEKISLTVHIEQLQYVSNMTSTNQKAHTLRVENLPKGVYSYYFSYIISGKEIRSPTYSFEVP